MKNKLILTLTLILTVATPITPICAHDGWLEYLASFIWEKQNEAKLLPTKSEQAQQQRPQPSAPNLDQSTHGQTSYQSGPAVSRVQREQVQRDVEAVIDALFATREQDRTAQREISAIKEQTIKCVFTPNTQYKSVQELRTAANNKLTNCLATIIAKNARLLYQQKAAKASGQPAYSPAYLAAQIEEDIKAQATLAITQNIHGILALFVGQELETHIAAKVMRDFPAPKQTVASAAPIAQAGDDIFEVYLHEQAARYEQSIAKIQQRTTHRETECSVCMDDFGGAKKRATLACGHSICPECLYNWLHQQHKKTCPVCRDIIRSGEFPATYLQKYIS